MKLQDLEVDRFLAQGESLAILAQSPQWSAFCDLLVSMRAAALEELATITDTGELRYWQGVAAAIAEILDRPGRIIDSAASFRDDEEADKGAIRGEIRALTRTLGDDI